MKALLISMSILLCHAQTWASVMPPTIARPYTFSFKKYEGEAFKYQVHATNSEDALASAAKACFDHYKRGRHISMEQGQDIIDICVNPSNI